jgi:phasin family protein
MSQKPKPGPQAKSGSAMKTALAETAAKVAPVSVEPAAKATPVVKAEPAPKGPVPAMPPPKVKPEVKAAPVVKMEPVPVPVPVPVAPPVIASVPPPVAAPLPMSAPVAAPMAAGVPDMAVEPVKAAAVIAAETIIETTAAAAKPVAATAETMAAAFNPTKPTLSQGMKTMMKSTEDLVAFSQANIEAFVKSSQIWSAGVQELTKQMASTAKASFEESVSTFKAITTCKSVKEAMDLQSSFAKAALEKAMAESNKLTDASIKLTEQTLAPITARVTVAVETFGKAA